MMQGNILIKWIHENEGYEYYENSRFLSLFLDCAIEKVDNKSVSIIFHDYVILQMQFCRRGIYLVPLNKTNSKVERYFVQEKLFHEYNSFFELKNADYRITQYNMYALIQYIEIVKKKIEAGFERYTKLIYENFKINETGFLKIGLNNAFSLEELQELIQSYNRLYSLFYYICQNGTDLINRNNINDISSRYSMVLESIHIGSEGVLVSVGVELIVDIIKSFIKSVYDLNRTEEEKRKKELIEKAELAEFVQTRQYIYQLIDILDAYLQKRESGCNPMVMAYIENEINNIVRKIEQLQGTKHIDLAI